MSKLNVPAGFFFGLLTLLQCATGHYLGALATGLLAAVLLLSAGGLRPAPAPPTATPPRTWRTLAMVLLLGALLGLSGYGVGTWLHRLSHAAASATPAR